MTLRTENYRYLPIIISFGKVKITKPQNPISLHEKRGLSIQFMAFLVRFVSWACILTHIGHEAAQALQELIDLPNLKL
jgi:hypothetical protein